MQKYEQYKRMLRFGLSVFSIVIHTGAFYYTWLRFYSNLMDAPFERRGHWLMVAFYILFLIIFAHMYGGWKIGVLKPFNLIYSQCLSVLFTDTMMYLIVTLLTKQFQNPWSILVMFLAQCAAAAIWGIFSSRCYLAAYPSRRVLLIYGDRPNLGLVKKFDSRTDRFIISRMIHISEGMEKIEKEIGGFEGVVIGDIPTSCRNEILKYCYEKSIRTHTSPKISDILIRSAESQHMFDTPILLSRNSGLSFEQRFVKRAIDIVLSFIALIVLSPVMLITAAVIKLQDGGSIIYKQTRMTENGRHFELLKFRSMCEGAEKDGVARLATESDARITKVGHFIRAFRVDELPQLLNILWGNMSIVGPRPERPEIAAQYGESIKEFSYRLKVKAGLTGYAQVYGKYNTTAYDKLKLDLTYIQNYSVRLDIEIIFQTIKILFMKESTEGLEDGQTTAVGGKDSGNTLSVHRIEAEIAASSLQKDGKDYGVR